MQELLRVPYKLVIWTQHGKTVESPEQAFTWAAKRPDSAAAQLLCAGLLHFRGGPLVYFLSEGGFGCYQVGADQYQTRVCLVNRQLAALQAPRCAEAGLSTAEL